MILTLGHYDFKISNEKNSNICARIDTIYFIIYIQFIPIFKLFNLRESKTHTFKDVMYNLFFLNHDFLKTFKNNCINIIV